MLKSSIELQTYLSLHLVLLMLACKKFILKGPMYLIYQAILKYNSSVTNLNLSIQPFVWLYFQQFCLNIMTIFMELGKHFSFFHFYFSTTAVYL